MEEPVVTIVEVDGMFVCDTNASLPIRFESDCQLLWVQSPAFNHSAQRRDQIDLRFIRIRWNGGLKGRVRRNDSIQQVVCGIFYYFFLVALLEKEATDIFRVKALVSQS